MEVLGKQIKDYGVHWSVMKSAVVSSFEWNSSKFHQILKNPKYSKGWFSIIPWKHCYFQQESN